MNYYYSQSKPKENEEIWYKKSGSLWLVLFYDDRLWTTIGCRRRETSQRKINVSSIQKKERNAYIHVFISALGKK